MKIEFVFVNNSIVAGNKEIFIKQTIIRRVKNRLENLLFVKGNQIINGFKEHCNNEIKVPSDLYEPTRTDFIVLIELINI